MRAVEEQLVAQILGRVFELHDHVGHRVERHVSERDVDLEHAQPAEREHQQPLVGRDLGDGSAGAALVEDLGVPAVGA